MSVALMTMRVAMMLSVQDGGTTASSSDDGFASGLALSLFSERRLDFFTE